MINRLLFLFAITGLLFASCQKEHKVDSTVVTTSLPFISEVRAEPSYVFGVGSGQILASIPDIIAVAVDSVVGFEGGFGGKTGKDTIYIRKADMKGTWPDTTASGGFSIDFEKFNLAGYKAHNPINIVLAAPIDNPGPTDFSGTYLRPSNGVTFDIVKVFPGVYVIDNPGGAGVPPTPYLLYNYKNSANKDSLAFPTQPNPCGGGLKLVSSTAPLGLTSAAYDASHPPTIVSLAPVTVAWRVLEFPDTAPGTANPGAALCQWGTGVRTFVKQ
jgi:hypothetical protein